MAIIQDNLTFKGAFVYACSTTYCGHDGCLRLCRFL